MNFGLFRGLPHEGSNEDFSKYREYKNSIPRKDVIAHIESLEPWLTSTPSVEIFTGDKIRAGLFKDGDFTFPYEFLHYYKNYDIGIPYEYEEYLRSIGIGE